MKWETGRQHVCYYKKKLWKFRTGKWGFDAYILKYPPAIALPWHKDPVLDARHYRLNLNLWGDTCFLVKEKWRYQFSIGQKIHFFRPDIQEHTLYNHPRWWAYKLSFGCAKYK